MSGAWRIQMYSAINALMQSIAYVDNEIIIQGISSCQYTFS